MIFSGARSDSNPTKFHWYLASTLLTMMLVSLFGIHKTYRLNSFHCQQTLGINCDIKNNFHLRSHCYTNKLRMYNEMDMFWVWLCFSLNLFWSTLSKGCIATFSLWIYSICASYRNFNIHALWLWIESNARRFTSGNFTIQSIILWSIYL